MNILALSFFTCVLTYVACGIAYIEMSERPWPQRAGLIAAAALSFFWAPWAWKLITANLAMSCG